MTAVIKPHTRNTGTSKQGIRGRCNTDWRTNNVGNAFNSNVTYYTREWALAKLYGLIWEAQARAAQQAGDAPAKDFIPKSEAQIGPLYSNYQPNLAANASVGLSAITEFRTRINSGLFGVALDAHWKRVLSSSYSNLDPASFIRMGHEVSKAVEARLIAHDLSTQENLFYVESYRLFAASSQTLGFATVPSIINYVVMFGDVVPDWKGLELHDQTCAILEAVETASQPYLSKLPQTASKELVSLGVEWTKRVHEALTQFLPEKSKPQENPDRSKSSPPLTNEQGGSGRYNLPDKDVGDHVRPPGGKNPPSLFENLPQQNEQDPDSRRLPAESRSLEELLRTNPLWTKDRKSYEEALSTILKRSGARQRPKSDVNPADRDPIPPQLVEFLRLIAQAGNQDRVWEDMRSDLVEEILRNTPFDPGPISGERVEGHEVFMEDAGEYYGGHLFDRTIELKRNAEPDPKLMKQSTRLSRILSQLVFPNREPACDVQPIMPSGKLDPARLALAECSEAIYRRFPTRELLDPSGRPVILVVNDASGSVGQAQMSLMKVLTLAWIQTCKKRDVRLLAGLYHQGSAGGLKNGPVVEWLYHPEKSVGRTHEQIKSAIAALPSTGSGGQADAISFQYMLNEAERLARGKTIYMVLMADCKWCQSFPDFKARASRNVKGAEAEVRAFFENARKRLKERLHTTLIALDALNPESYENVVDKVLVVRPDELSDYASVARKVGAYVAQCMRERRKLESD